MRDDARIAAAFEQLSTGAQKWAMDKSLPLELVEETVWHIRRWGTVERAERRAGSTQARRRAPRSAKGGCKERAEKAKTKSASAARTATIALLTAAAATAKSVCTATTTAAPAASNAPRHPLPVERPRRLPVGPRMTRLIYPCSGSNEEFADRNLNACNPHE